MEGEKARGTICVALLDGGVLPREFSTPKLRGLKGLECLNLLKKILDTRKVTLLILTRKSGEGLFIGETKRVNLTLPR